MNTLPNQPSADAEGLQLAMQRRALHADEFRCARDVAGETADLGDQVVAFENFPRLAERQSHDLLAIVACWHGRNHPVHFLLHHIRWGHKITWPLPHYS